MLYSYGILQTCSPLLVPEVACRAMTCCALQSKLRLGKLELMQKLRVADAMSRSLCQELHEIEAQQRAWEPVVQDLKQTTPRYQQKTQQYQNDLARFKRQLDKDNFSEEVSISGAQGLQYPSN